MLRADRLEFACCSVAPAAQVLPAARNYDFCGGFSPGCQIRIDARVNQHEVRDARRVPHGLNSPRLPRPRAAEMARRAALKQSRASIPAKLQPSESCIMDRPAHVS